MARSNDSVYRIRLELPNGRVQFSNDVVLALASESGRVPLFYPNPSDGRELTLHLLRDGQHHAQRLLIKKN